MEPTSHPTLRPTVQPSASPDSLLSIGSPTRASEISDEGDSAKSDTWQDSAFWREHRLHAAAAGALLVGVCALAVCCLMRRRKKRDRLSRNMMIASSSPQTGIAAMQMSPMTDSHVLMSGEKAQAQAIAGAKGDKEEESDESVNDMFLGDEVASARYQDPLTRLLREHGLYAGLHAVLRENEFDLEMRENHVKMDEVDGLCEELGLGIKQKIQFRKLMEIVDDINFKRSINNEGDGGRPVPLEENKVTVQTGTETGGAV